MIKRIEFIGFSVAGPRGTMRPAYKASEWPGWTVEVDGAFLLLRGEGRVVEIPRARCVVDRTEEKKVPDALAASMNATHPVIAQADAKKRGRPPKVQAEDLMGKEP